MLHNLSKFYGVFFSFASHIELKHCVIYDVEGCLLLVIGLFVLYREQMTTDNAGPQEALRSRMLSEILT